MYANISHYNHPCKVTKNIGGVAYKKWKGKQGVSCFAFTSTSVLRFDFPTA